MKFVLWAALALLVYWLLRGEKRIGTRPSASPPPPPPPPPTAPNQPEAMLRCAHCGIHVPASEAVQADGAAFCSEEHRACHAAS